MLKERLFAAMSGNGLDKLKPDSTSKIWFVKVYKLLTQIAALRGDTLGDA
jgi:hypothetical protein